MGQQQLLLLVLATVIVGLATVAGIQAFNENQAQASQDALVQKATSMASDIKGLQGKPTQLGGINLNTGDGYSGVSDIVNALGYENNPVDAQGAGTNGRCEIKLNSGTARIDCASDDAPQDVRVEFDPDASGDEISTSFSSSGYNVSTS